MTIKKATACLLLTLLLLSCGTEGGKFRLEGRLRNINQAEFWVYSTDGAIDGVDTIRVRDGRFGYEMLLEEDATLMLVFPNYSELPVFAHSGSRATIKGDATHLKEIVIEGTADNEDLTTLRMKLNDLMPPDIPKAVGDFIEKNPASLASIYLLQHYFVQNKDGNLREAYRLASLLLKHNPENGQLMHLHRQLKDVQGAPVGTLLPAFTAKDVHGRRVTEGSLRAAANVVYTWTTWSFASNALQNRLTMLKQRHGDKLSVMGICLDADPKMCSRRVTRDSLKWSTVCDGQMWATPLLAKFGFYNVPGNVIADKSGKIVARDVTPEKMEEQINKLLK